MAPNGSTMGLSEIRAASGALFIGLGLGAIFLATPLAYAMIGFAWGGAAVGRLTSIVADGDASRQKITFFVVEAAVAATLLAINL
jgi:predicted membrane channel-forming protein YqfA (hemolysin III family)